MTQPFKLFRLQQIDNQLDRTRARLHEIEVALSEDEALRQAREHSSTAEQKLQSERKALRHAEENVREQRVKIEQTEATLYGGKVRNPKELQDLQNEIAALKRYLAVLEDRQLEAMLAEEEALAVHQSATAELERAQVASTAQHQSLFDEQARLQKDLERTAGERQAAASSIPEADMLLYEKLRQTRRGIAVAKVTPDRACSACGTTLNAVLMDAARNPNQISRCDTCGRILYVG